MSDEAEIIINGTRLTPAQAMAVRVFCMSGYQEMSENSDALGDDDLGRAMVAAYLARISEVLRMMAPR